VATELALDGHSCSEATITSAVMCWLTLPTDSWPANLPWNCHQCGARQGGAVRLCTICPGSNRSRAWALKLLLDKLSHSLSLQLPESVSPSKFYPMDLLISLLLSPHGINLSGMLTNAYARSAARTGICVEEGGGGGEVPQ
jgi:hypothetical protein